MKILITLLLSLFLNTAFSDGIVFGPSSTINNPHIAGSKTSGINSDGTSIFNAIGGTNILSIASNGLSVNGGLNVTNGSCTTTSAGLCASYNTGNAYINIPTGAYLNYKVNGTVVGSFDFTGHFRAFGGSPTLGTCGTSTIAANGNDNSFSINITAGAPASCVINFHTTMPIGTLCVASPAATGSTAISYLTTTTTAVTLFGTSMTGTWNVLCF